jgi:hypothetical protein
MLMGDGVPGDPSSRTGCTRGRSSRQGRPHFDAVGFDEVFEPKKMVGHGIRGG